jgi:cell division protein DivIC
MAGKAAGKRDSPWEKTIEKSVENSYNRRKKTLQKKELGMSAKRKKKKKKRSAGTMSIGIIVLAFMAVMSVQIYRLKQKDDAKAAEVDALEQELAEETQRAEEIDELEAYMQTTQFIEDTAKSKLGLAYDNEIIFKEIEE